MCLILFAYKMHPKYTYVVAANRDEFYERPTVAAHFWKDEPTIFAGRDLEKMGTWMGVTKTGRFAALTNYRDPSIETAGKASRGELVTSALTHEVGIEAYMSELEKMPDKYPGYNLIAGNQDELYYYSNIEKKVRKLEPGIYGVSNHLLNTDWPKIKLGKEQLTELLSSKSEVPVDELFTLLVNEQSAPDHLLPNTGVSIDLERMLSSIFIKSSHYGTRSSTVLFIDKKQISFYERIFANGRNADNHYTIPLQ